MSTSLIRGSKNYLSNTVCGTQHTCIDDFQLHCILIKNKSNTSEACVIYFHDIYANYKDFFIKNITNFFVTKINILEEQIIQTTVITIEKEQHF